MMLKWLKNLVTQPEAEHRVMSGDEALEALQILATDAAIEEIYEGLDNNAGIVATEVRRRVDAQELGSYPLYAAVIWLSYQEGNNDRVVDAGLREQLDAALVWAFQFELNNVLLGAALGALDALHAEDREQTALRLLDELVDVSERRYWLLLKVRSPVFLEAVGEALGNYQPKNRAKMAGAFRQFKLEDLSNALRYLDVAGPGAEMFAEALGVIDHPDARAKLKVLAQSEHANVRATAAALLR